MLFRCYSLFQLHWFSVFNCFFLELWWFFMVFVPLVPVGFGCGKWRYFPRLSEKNVPSCVATWHGWMKSMDSNDFFETVSKRPDLLPQYLDAAKEWPHASNVSDLLDDFRWFHMISDFYRPPCPEESKNAHVGCKTCSKRNYCVSM